jgi:hypothetical protein
VALGLRTTTDLLAWVQVRSLRRKALDGSERALLTGLEAFCFRNQTDLSRRVSFAWEMHEAPQLVALQTRSAWELVERAAEGPCICGGVWQSRTEQLLDMQSAAYSPMAPQEERPTPEAVRSAIVTALRNGCGKHTNLFVYGPNTTGKSHILKPLAEVFADCCFVRPAGKGNYPLEKLFGAKVCVLQDIRTSTFKLAWDDLLIWFEGDRFTVPLPRNRHGGDRDYAERAPIFISTGSKFTISKKEADQLGVNRQEQNAMMDARFRFFHFPRSLTAAEKIVTPACKRCFAVWLLADR